MQLHINVSQLNCTATSYTPKPSPYHNWDKNCRKNITWHRVKDLRIPVLVELHKSRSSSGSDREAQRSLASAEMEKGHQLFTPTTKAELETQMSAQQYQSWFANSHFQSMVMNSHEHWVEGMRYSSSRNKTTHQVRVPPCCGQRCFQADNYNPLIIPKLLYSLQ